MSEINPLAEIGGRNGPLISTYPWKIVMMLWSKKLILMILQMMMIGNRRIL